MSGLPASYSRRLRWAGLGAATGAAIYIVNTSMYRKRVCVCIDNSKIGATREVARRECTVLKGYDVVVKQMSYTGPLLPPPVNSKSPSFTERIMNPDNTSFFAGWVQYFFANDLKPKLSTLQQNDPLNSVETYRTGTSVESPTFAHDISVMTLEPQKSKRADRSFFESFLDSATEQSLVQCSHKQKHMKTASTTCVNEGTSLLAPYLRVMMCALALVPANLAQALRIGQVGVAGGSLPMFLKQHFSHRIKSIDLVDIEPVCFEMAAAHMGLEDNITSLFNFHPVDGRLFLATEQGKLDVLFLDMFVGAESPAFLKEPAFLETCRLSLSHVGVAAFNLPRPDEAFVKSCGSVFGRDNVFVVPCPTSTNNIVFALRANRQVFDRRHFLTRVKQFSETHKLPYDLEAHFPLWWRV